MPALIAFGAGALTGALVLSLVCRRRVDEAREAQRAATAELLANVSHELRTPLTSVIGILAVLDDEVVELDPGERHELMALAGREAARLKHLVENVHSMSRVVRQVLQPEVVPIRLVDAITHNLRVFPAAERRTFVACDPEAIVAADPKLFDQILANLLQNAERYAPDGELEITCASDGPGKVKLLVSDDGPGIPPERREAVFDGVSSTKGLGLGLHLSRSLARAMGGDLRVVDPCRSGTTFELSLPASAEPPVDKPAFVADTVSELALSPRARILVDMATVLAERSLDRVVARLQGLYAELLGASRGVLLVRAPTGEFLPAGSFGGDVVDTTTPDDPLLREIAGTRAPVVVPSLDAIGARHWHDILGGDAALVTPVTVDDRIAGVLVVGWEDARRLPDVPGRQVAMALAELAGFAIQRHSLLADAAYERRLRASVMECLPIAISVFVGDPPRVVDWNARERALLGIADDVERPSDLEASQTKFHVRFADGTPLTGDNAPVVEAIRSGKSLGPFLLLVRRTDGTEIMTRTYCAPFHDEDGTVLGAVVTSEELDVVAPPRGSRLTRSGSPPTAPS